MTHETPDTAPDTPPWWRRGRFGPLVSDLEHAPRLGWNGMAGWIRATLTALGSAAVAAVGILLLWGLFHLATGLVHWSRDHLTAGTVPDGVLLTVTDPVRRYLDAHTQSLPLDGGTTFRLWAWTGLIALIVAALGSTGARLTWTAWGAATVAMVWAGTEDPGRAVAAAIAVLAWTAASVLALRGLTLRSIVVQHIDNHPPAAPDAD
ncbi:hypothetical protein [Embleya sp. NPDC020630]|uniref:hypothetical protein n=1 Tax=Embleya sp. NPDC020630 TaxID=3363979 RepID=UPI0037AB24CB